MMAKVLSGEGDVSVGLASLLSGAGVGVEFSAGSGGQRGYFRGTLL